MDKAENGVHTESFYHSARKISSIVSVLVRDISGLDSMDLYILDSSNLIDSIFVVIFKKNLKI